jgi:hypothetical protein
MRSGVLRSVIALSLATALVLVASTPVVATLPGYSSINAGQFFIIRGFVAQVGGSISYDVQVISPPGTRVDVLLMDRHNFELYKSGSSFSYQNASTLNFEFAHDDTNTGDLIEGLEYYLIIDNTDRPVGGANGSAEVGVEYYFGGYNIQSVLDWGIVLMILVVAAVAVVPIMVLTILIQRSKRRGQV